MIQPAPHTLHRFDDDLAQLKETIAAMGTLACRQIDRVLEALAKRDADQAREVVAAEAELDRLHRDAEEQVVRIIALHQPVALDLRWLIGMLKAANDLERIGDHAANAAKRTITLCSLPAVGSLNGFERMGRIVRDNVRIAVSALIEAEAEKAEQVWSADVSVDEIHTGIFRELLTYMMEDTRIITPATHLLFIAKSFERIGDHATNIAESAVFVARAETPSVERPRGDEAPETVVLPPPGNNEV